MAHGLLVRYHYHKFSTPNACGTGLGEDGCRSCRRDDLCPMADGLESARPVKKVFLPWPKPEAKLEPLVYHSRRLCWLDPSGVWTRS